MWGFVCVYVCMSHQAAQFYVSITVIALLPGLIIIDFVGQAHTCLFFPLSRNSAVGPPALNHVWGRPGGWAVTERRSLGTLVAKILTLSMATLHAFFQLI